MRAAKAIRARHEPVLAPDAEDMPGLWDGTALAVPGGVRPVESLRAGDPVLTRDDGPQPVRQILRWRAARDAAPVRVAAGALGNLADCFLAPGTRVLISGWEVELHFAVDACLVPVSALLGTAGVARAEPPGGGCSAIVLDRPSLVRADGIEIECLAETGKAGAPGPRSRGSGLSLPVIGGAEARLLRPN